MPAANSKTEAVERLRLLLAVLTADWQDRDELIERYVSTSNVPCRHAGALALGFQVERSEGHHDPQWRIVGHERFGAVQCLATT